jgi:ribulose-bisphosphate carboxylase large chain
MPEFADGVTRSPNGDQMQTIRATYYIETRISLHEAAQRLANEQSAGLSDNDIQMFNDASIGRGQAEVLGLREIVPQGADLRMAQTAPKDAILGKLVAAEVVVEYQTLEQGFGIEQLINVALGEPHLLGVLAACRLINLESDEFESWSGPAIGDSRLFGGTDARGPLLCAPIKPSTGLSVEEHADRGIQAARGGASIIKDDELCHDTSFNPLKERTGRVMAGLRELARAGGEPKTYVVNVIGARSTLRHRLDTALEAGATAVMVAPGLMGLDVVAEARAHVGRDVHVFVHNSFATVATRPPTWGMTLSLWAWLQRGLGADVVLLPSPGGSFGIDFDETRATVLALQGDFNGWRKAGVAHSGSMNAHSIEILKTLHPDDRFIMTSGSGLFDHPDGPESGARELAGALRGAHPNSGWAKQWKVYS